MVKYNINEQRTKIRGIHLIRTTMFSYSSFLPTHILFHFYQVKPFYLNFCFLHTIKIEELWYTFIVSTSKKLDGNIYLQEKSAVYTLWSRHNTSLINNIRDGHWFDSVCPKYITGQRDCFTHEDSYGAV